VDPCSTHTPSRERTHRSRPIRCGRTWMVTTKPQPHDMASDGNKIQCLAHFPKERERERDVLQDTLLPLFSTTTSRKYTMLTLHRTVLEKQLSPFPTFHNMKVHYRAHNSPTPVPVVSHKIPVHTFPSCFLRTTLILYS
jgi:hypothetical protein